MSEYNLSSIKVQVDSNSVATAILDMPESSANVLTEGLFAELDHLFSDLEKRDDLRGLVLLSAKRNIFVAGADLKRIHRTLDWPDEKIIQFCEDGRMVMSRLSRMPFATVAAIHGACVGGGLELTLWCDYRVVADDKRTVLGLPEVKLGLVPGWAGTVRLPRLAGLENGIDLIASGRLVTAKQSLEMGFVDQIAELESLESAAKDLTLSASLEDLKNLRRAILGPVQPVSDIDALHRRSIERVEQNSETFSFAPKIVVNHLVESSSLDHDAACHRESLAMAAVYGSEPNYGLLNNFFLGEHNKKNPGFVDLKLAVREFKKVGIVGAGTMGLGVARACAQSRFDVVVLDAAEDVVRRAKVALLDEGLNEKADLKFTQQYADLSDCDLVVESVVEIADVKRSVLQNIESSIRHDALIATGTSAIPVEKLASSLKAPKRFSGVHFCHPALMQLVEVIRGSFSGDSEIADVVGLLRKLRKSPVVVKDCPGFVVNRLLAALLDQSIRLLSWGYTVEQIDQSARELGFRAGPFEIIDIIGADVCMYAGREMYDGGIKAVTLSPVLPRMVKSGFLGRKSERGFYVYTEDSYELNPEVNKLLADYRDEDFAVRLKADEIAESICCCMILESIRILEEQIVADPNDVDFCVIHGFAFPAHRGGLLFWARRFGLEKVFRLLEKISSKEEKIKPPADLVERFNGLVGVS